MKSKISALIDDELEAHEIDGIVAALRNDPEALDTWRIYHLVGDSMRQTRPLSAGFSERFSRRLAGEPIALAPRRLAPKSSARARWVTLSAAASVAAVALVGWVAFAPGLGGGALVAEQPTVAQTQQPVAAASEPKQARNTAVANVAARSAARALPGSARDYLLAHQAYSPRAAVQGITPNVQTVSETEIVKGAR